jgi:hypothetical protein
MCSKNNNNLLEQISNVVYKNMFERSLEYILSSRINFLKKYYLDDIFLNPDFFKQFKNLKTNFKFILLLFKQLSNLFRFENLTENLTEALNEKPIVMFIIKTYFNLIIYKFNLMNSFMSIKKNINEKTTEFFNKKPSIFYEKYMVLDFDLIKIENNEFINMINSLFLMINNDIDILFKYVFHDIIRILCETSNIFVKNIVSEIINEKLSSFNLLYNDNSKLFDVFFENNDIIFLKRINFLLFVEGNQCNKNQIMSYLSNTDIKKQICSYI